MWELIRANKRNSIVLLVLMAAALLILGYIIGAAFAGELPGMRSGTKKQETRRLGKARTMNGLPGRLKMRILMAWITNSASSSPRSAIPREGVLSGSM